MNKSLFLAFILFFLFSSCQFFEKKSAGSADLQQTVQKVIAGTDTTSKLIGLRDKQLPAANDPNFITTDTFYTFGKRYFTILAEYPNPVYNRFAVVDPDYNVLLIDKSLNGSLSEEIVHSGQLHFIQVEDNFISKGILGLKRISLYSIDDNGEAGLVFRTFTELREPGITYRQDIVRIGAREIQTKIYSTNQDESKLDRDGDIFSYDIKTVNYSSEDHVFDSFVISEVQDNVSQTDKPEITSRDSYLKQLGVNPQTSTTNHKLGNFSMPLSEEWNEVKNVKISVMLNRPVSGTKFINNHYGAEISVIQIPAEDSSESYIRYPLDNISSGNYRVRFSDKTSGGKYYYQFFEYSCGNEKFLLILQTLKTTYDEYKSDYQNLINSFSMEC